MSQSCTRFLAPALVDPLTLPSDGALDSAPWLHQTLQKSSHHDQTTGWPRLRGNVIFTRSSQYNPLYAFVLVNTRYPYALVLVHAHATPVLLTIRQSGSHLSIHSCTSACLSISYWFTHKPTIFTIPERSIHTHRRFLLLHHL